MRASSQVIAPMIRGATYRRWLYLLVGAMLLVPYLVAGRVVSSMVDARSFTPAGIACTLAAATGGLILTGTIPVMRPLIVMGARTLLDPTLPEQRAQHRPSWAARWRTGLWFAVHLLGGGGTVIVTVGALLFIIQLYATPFSTLPLWDDQFVPMPVHHLGWWAVPLAITLTVALTYAVAGLGTLLAKAAHLLLRPSPAERLADLQRQTDELIQRDRLAHELHDSIGHALTVTTLQAGAARRLLDTEPDFARQALAAIETVGRTALDDLDHVLGLLRAGEPSTRTTKTTSNRRTLADLDLLLAETEATGAVINTEIIGNTDAVPQATSREVYRVIQEGITNAVRHAPSAPISLRLEIRGDRLELRMSNPLVNNGARPGASRGGQGLRSIRERVSLLRGQVTARDDDQQWRVVVELPLRLVP